jgi:hypothetical protein
MFPGQVNRHHWGFDDPAHATGSEEEQLAVFRRGPRRNPPCLRSLCRGTQRCWANRTRDACRDI